MSLYKLKRNNKVATAQLLHYKEKLDYHTKQVKRYESYIQRLEYGKIRLKQKIKESKRK